MTARQNAYLQMYAALKATIDAHNAKWATFLPFSDAYTDFLALLDEATDAIALQSTSTEGASTGKKTARTVLMDLTLKLANVLYLHGKLNNLPKLADAAYSTPSDLKKMREKYLVGHTEKLLGLAAELPTGALTPYNLPTGFLTSVQTANAAFNTLIGTPRHQQAESVRGTQDLDTVIEDALEVLQERMDPAVAVLGADAPDFYSEYQTSRELIDPGYTVRELTVTVHSTNGEPLAGVRARITPGDLQKFTGANGMFYIDDLDGGEHSMTLELDGFITRTVTFMIVDGEATVEEYTLTPVGGGAGD